MLDVPTLHEHQRRTIESTAGGRDTLLVAPTGSGKSECYFGAGVVRGGLTAIVSPLRALIADQRRRLDGLGLPCRIWNGDVRASYKTETARLIRDGWSGFVLTTPESLKGKQLSSALTGRVNTAVIDESHCCLRDRGFRVSYAWLGRTLDRLGPAVRFACTATLPMGDRSALIRTLHLHDPVEVYLPVTRSNITIRTTLHHKSAITGILDEHDGECGILYTATIATARKLVAQLQAEGRSVVLYHGQLRAKQKVAAQAAFFSGEKQVAVATDSLGLGIDKPDIRFVASYDHHESIEAWVQAFGRGGRDGRQAFAYGCFSGSDEGRASRQFLINAKYPPVADLEAVWRYLISAPFRDEPQNRIGEKVLGRRGKYSTPVTVLQRFGLAEAKPHPDDGRRKLYAGRGDFDAVDWTAYLAECRDTCERFDKLCDLAELPDGEIAEAIDEYFGTPESAGV